MSFDFNNDVPIYLQIIEDIKIKIISGKYIPNQKLQSVRDLSMVYQVNPNTMQKALAELESIGLIYTERTNGKFITNDASIINSIKENTINERFDEFFKSMADIGLSKKQIIDLLKGKE